MTKTVGVIGLGSIGMVHVRNMEALGCAVRGYDVDTDRKGLYNADALVLALPSNQHCVEILETPIHIPLFVEKPIGVTPGDLEFLKRHIHEHKLVMMANNMRYHPVIKEIKARLPDLGRVTLATFAIKQKKENTTDPCILNWGSHEADLALYLFGESSHVRLATVESDKAEFMMIHKNDTTSHIIMDYLTEPQERWVTMVSDRGIMWADLEQMQVNIQTDEYSEMIICSGSHADTHKEEMAEFLRRVDGQEPDGIGATGEDGLRCLEVLLEAQRLGEKVPCLSV